MRRRRRASWSFAWLGVSSLSCSLLVSGEPEPLRCSLEGQIGPPACDAGLICSSGICQARLAPAGDGGAAGEPTEVEGGAGAGGAP